MVESGFFMPVRIADIESTARYDEASGMTPEESVMMWIRQTEEK